MGDTVEVTVGEAVEEGVGVRVPLRVGVEEGVDVRVPLRVGVGEGVCVGVREGVCVTEAVGVRDALGVGVGTLTARTLCLSRTRMFPVLSTARPMGWENAALVPTPTACVLTPLPARVVASPQGVTLRTR